MEWNYQIESRKKFIKELSGKNDTSTRTGGTVASSLYLMMQGVQIIRVHEVNEIIQGIKVFKELIKNWWQKNILGLME